MKQKKFHAWWKNKETLEQVVQGSNSIQECLQKLNLRVAGGNFASFREGCNAFGITVPECNSRTAEHLHKIRPAAKPIKEFLVTNSNANRGSLKKRLIKEGILDLECAECHIGPEWNSKPLILQLDHINGVHNDNRLENLRLLCPNCHSQTDNFAGRSKSILPMGQARRKETKPRRKSSIPRKTKIDWPDVATLKEMVADSSYREVGRQLGVSDTSVKKRITSKSASYATGQYTT